MSKENEVKEEIKQLNISATYELNQNVQAMDNLIRLSIGSFSDMRGYGKFIENMQDLTIESTKLLNTYHNEYLALQEKLIKIEKENKN